MLHNGVLWKGQFELQTVTAKVPKVIKQIGSLTLSVVLLSGFFFMVSIKNAHAYIDLGSAGLMLQMAIASAFGALFALKVYWRTFVGKVSRVVSKIKGTSPRE